MNMRRIGKITICAVLFLMLTNFVNAQDEKSVKGIVGKEHYVSSNGLKVYLWEKYHKDYAKSFKQSKKIVLLVHGSIYVLEQLIACNELTCLYQRMLVL